MTHGGRAAVPRPRQMRSAGGGDATMRGTLGCLRKTVLARHASSGTSCECYGSVPNVWLDAWLGGSSGDPPNVERRPERSGRARFAAAKQPALRGAAPL